MQREKPPRVPSRVRSSVGAFCSLGLLQTWYGSWKSERYKGHGSRTKEGGTCWVASGWASSYISAMAELADGRKGGVGQSQIVQTPTRTAQRGTMGNGEWGMGDGSWTTGCVGWGRGRGNGKRWWSQRRAHARTHARTNERNGGPSSGDRGTSQGGGRARAWAREREGEGRRRCVKHGSHGLHCLDRPGGAVRCGALRGAARVACYRREGERQETVGERLAGGLAGWLYYNYCTGAPSPRDKTALITPRQGRAGLPRGGQAVSLHRGSRR